MLVSLYCLRAILKIPSHKMCPLVYFHLEHCTGTPHFNSRVHSHLQYLQSMQGSSRANSAAEKPVPESPGIVLYYCIKGSNEQERFAFWCSIYYLKLTSI